MTLSSVISRISYSGDGSTTVFSFPYYFIDEADLVVIITDTNGTETTQTITTEYTVTGEGVSAGGSVTMITAPGATDTLTIYRDPAIKQTLDLVENDSLPAEDHEQNLDKMVMMMQRLSDRMDRAVTLSEGFSGTFSTLLPSTLTADSVLQINASGTGVSVGPTATEVSNAQTYATNAANSASAASTSATNAASSATAAASSASQAASTLASAFFNDVVFYTNADSPITLDSTSNGKLLSFDTSGGAITVTLPTIASETMPFNIAFLLATAGNDLTVNRAGTDTIGSAGTSKVLSVANTGFQLAADTDTSPDRWTPLEFGSVGDGTVTTDKLADANVTRAKLATGAVANKSISTKTADYTATSSDDVILVNPFSEDITITLPAVSGVNGKNLVIKRIDSTVLRSDTFVDGNINTGTENINIASHPFTDLEPVQLTTTGTLPTGLSLNTDYWVIYVDSDNIMLASSYANAVADTPVNITAAAGGGTHVITTELRDVIIDGNSSETIDGSTTRYLYIQNESISITASSSGWNIDNEIKPTIGIHYTSNNGGTVGTSATDYVFEDLVTDNFNQYNITTGNYKAISEGWHNISVQLAGDSEAYSINGFLTAFILVNGTVIRQALGRAGSTGTLSLWGIGSMAVYLSKGDIVNIQGQSSVATNTIISGGNERNILTITSK